MDLTVKNTKIYNELTVPLLLLKSCTCTTVNNKSYTGEQFCGSLDFIINLEKTFSVLLFNKNKNKFLHII